MNSKTGKKVYKIIMLIVVVAIVTFIVTTVLVYNYYSSSITGRYSSSENTKLNAKINIINKILKNDYLGNIDEEKLINSAIKGYVDGIDDKYTEYYTKEEMEQMKTDTNGKYVGIGIYIMQDIENNNIVIISTIKGSPAESAGLKSGDIIEKIDENKITSEDFNNISSYIKEKNDTNVNIEIKRGEQILSFNVERKTIELHPIESEIVENNIGYINISSFDEDSAKEFKENFNKLNKENINSLIIDLRNNGGGIVDETLEILDYILDKDSIMMITVNKNNEEKVEKATKNPIINMPIVVLVNENTASSSEIFASALKENKKATIVGTKTYGKGLIQELLTLSDGSGIKITTEEYYTSSKNKINKVGITPDVEIKLPDNIESIYSIERKDDTQLRGAVDLLK